MKSIIILATLIASIYADDPFDKIKWLQGHWRSEFSGKGLQVIGPTRLYGYTAQIEHASASDELRYIDAVRQRFYSGLLDMPVPISKYNFDTYGASTTPTLVLLDREGKVAMYHPGALPYDQLRAEIEKVVAR